MSTMSTTTTMSTKLLSQLSISILLFLCIISISCTTKTTKQGRSSSGVVFQVQASKHKFSTVRDHRTFIGPIGAPFGFLEYGIYELNVSRFQLQVKDHHRHQYKSSSSSSSSSKKRNDVKTKQQQEEYVNELHAGFLLKRFETENEFAFFQEEIYDNVTKCGFHDFIHGGEFAQDDDSVHTNLHTNVHDNLHTNLHTNVHDNLHDNDYYEPKEFDDKVATGKGVIDGGQAGIFLSMKNKEQMWAPNAPSLHHTFTIEEAGYYFLFYQICLPHPGEEQNQQQNQNQKQKQQEIDLNKYLFKEITSNFVLEFEYKNYDSFGKVSHLTAGEMPLPHIYLYFTISYILMLVIWVQSMNPTATNITPTATPAAAAAVTSAAIGQENQIVRKPTIYAIHHLMSSVVFLKILTMLLESVRYHYIRVNGHAELWSFVFYLTNFFKGTFLFTVILLIGSGWSFFKPFLTVKERRIILFVMVLQVIDNIALAFLSNETENERAYNEWTTVLHLVDIISCCAVLLPIVWQVNSLEESVDVGAGDGDGDEVNTGDSSSDAASAAPPSRLYSKLDLFRSFYLVVVGYIYFTRIVIYLFASALNYHQTWIKYFVYELGTLTFYFLVGMKFRPIVEDHSYSQIQALPDEEDEEDQHTAKIEMSSLSIGKIAKD